MPNSPEDYMHHDHIEQQHTQGRRLVPVEIAWVKCAKTAIDADKIRVQQLDVTAYWHSISKQAYEQQQETGPNSIW